MAAMMVLSLAACSGGAPAETTAAAETEAVTESEVSLAEEYPFLSDEPYQPVLTLDPEPWEPEELNGAEREHEQ